MQEPIRCPSSLTGFVLITDCFDPCWIIHTHAIRCNFRRETESLQNAPLVQLGRTKLQLIHSDSYIPNSSIAHIKLVKNFNGELKVSRINLGLFQNLIFNHEGRHCLDPLDPQTRPEVQKNQNACQPVRKCFLPLPKSHP